VDVSPHGFDIESQASGDFMLSAPCFRHPWMVWETCNYDHPIPEAVGPNRRLGKPNFMQDGGALSLPEA